MNREVNKRIKEYDEKEIDYLVGKRVVGENRKLLKLIIVVGELLNRFHFIESSQHLAAAKSCMVRDLRRLENKTTDDFLTPEVRNG